MDQGASFTEYGAVILLVAAVSASVIASGIGPETATLIRDAICKVTGGGECDDPAREDEGTPSAAGEDDPATTTEEPEPAAPAESAEGDAGDGVRPAGPPLTDGPLFPDPEAYPCGPSADGDIESLPNGSPPFLGSTFETQGHENATVLADLISGPSGLGEIGDLPRGLHTDLSYTPTDIDGVVDDYPSLVDFLDSHGPLLNNEDYAVGLVNELGPENVRNLIDRINTYGLRELDDEGITDQNAAYSDYVEPLATLLATADRSGRLDPEVREAITDPEPPPIEEIISDDAHIDLRQTVEEMEENDDLDDLSDVSSNFEITDAEFHMSRERANSVLLHAGDFSPRTTADLAAPTLTYNHTLLDGADLTEGFRSQEFFEEGDHDSSLADSRWIAMEALANDPNAATLFYEDPDNVEIGEYWADESSELYDGGGYNPALVNIEVALDDMDRYDLAEVLQDRAADTLDARCD